MGSARHEAGESQHRSSLHRVIVHLDLDCFYAQVEAKRLGVHPDVPLAVQQWQGIIAVNYPARAAGVKRHLNVAEAKKQCPGLVLVHVETIGDDDDPPGEGEEDDHGDVHGATATVETGDGGAPVHRGQTVVPDRNTRKVSLRRYRRASAEIMTALSRVCATVERASIDEAYVDVTADVDAVCERGDGAANDAATRGVAASGYIHEPEIATSDLDRRLAIGAEMCARMRAAVKTSTGFTMSGGVAHNKMLAKLASARNKPNKQTIVSWRAVDEMLASLPMRSVKGLGGKLGETVEAVLSAHLGATIAGSGRGSSYEGGFTVAALQSLPTEALSRRIDVKTATWLQRISRGDDNDPVVPNVNDGGKSITAFKSFAAIADPQGVHRWLRVLARELAGRLLEDRVALRRTPRTLRLEHRAALRADHAKNWNAGRTSELTEMKSKQFPFPPGATRALAAAAAAEEVGDGDEGRLKDATGEAIALAAISAFDRAGSEALPCTRVGLAAGDFTPLPSAKGGIEKFFGSAPVDAGAPRGAEYATCPPPLVPRKKKKTGLDRFFQPQQQAEESLPPSHPGPDKDAEPTGIEGEPAVDSTAMLEEEDDVSVEKLFPSYVECARCGERHVAGRDAQEHADWHVAMDLSAEGAVNGAPAPSSRSVHPLPASRGGRGGKRKRGRGDNSAVGYKANPLTSFFKK